MLLLGISFLISACLSLTSDDDLYTLEFNHVLEDTDFSSMPLPSAITKLDDLVDYYAKLFEGKNNEKEDPSLTYMHNKNGNKFACKMPSEPVKEQLERDSPNPRSIQQLLKRAFSTDKCIHKKLPGWWRYEFCFNKKARQIHVPDKENKEDSQRIEIAIGTMPTQITIGERVSPRDQLYVEQIYENGDACTLSGKTETRRTIVRFFCDPRIIEDAAFLDDVSEIRSCEYLFKVNTGALCKMTHFKKPSLPSRRVVCSRLPTHLDRVFQVAQHAIPAMLQVRSRSSREHLLSAIRYFLYAQRTALKNESWLMCPDPKDDSYDWRAMERTADGDVAVDERVRRALAAITAAASTHTVTHIQLFLTRYRNTVMDLAQLPKDILKDLALTAISMEYGIFTKQSLFIDMLLDEKEAERSYLWEYFSNPHWDRREFPRSMDTVDYINGYIEMSEWRMQDGGSDAETWRRRFYLGHIEPYPEQPLDEIVIVEELVPLFPPWLSQDWMDQVREKRQDTGYDDYYISPLLREMLASDHKLDRAAVKAIPHRLMHYLKQVTERGKDLPSIDTICQHLARPIAAGNAMYRWHDDMAAFEPRSEREMNKARPMERRRLASLVERLMYAREYMEVFGTLEKKEFEEHYVRDRHNVETEERQAEVERLVTVVEREERRILTILADVDRETERRRLIEENRMLRGKERMLDARIDSLIFDYEYVNIFDNTAAKTAADIWEDELASRPPKIKPPRDWSQIHKKIPADEIISVYKDTFKHLPQQHAYDGN